MNQGPAELQSAALTTELCTLAVISQAAHFNWFLPAFIEIRRADQCAKYVLRPPRTRALACLPIGVTLLMCERIGRPQSRAAPRSTSTTTILCRMRRMSLDLRSQAAHGPVSARLRGWLGRPQGAVGFCFAFSLATNFPLGPSVAAQRQERKQTT